MFYSSKLLLIDLMGVVSLYFYPDLFQQSTLCLTYLIIYL